MKNNYTIENNHLKTEAFDVEFNFSIREVIYYDGIFVVLLGIPMGVYETNNIYGVDERGNKVWRIEDPEKRFHLNKTGDPRFDGMLLAIYEGMTQDADGSFFGITFWAMKYTFEYKTGKLLDKEWMRW